MSTTATLAKPWIPTPAEVAAIRLEMRPVIDRIIERDRRALQHAAVAA